MLRRRRLALLAMTGPVAIAASGLANAAELPVAIPHAPVATDEDLAVQITLSGSDADGDELTFSVSTLPANGTVPPDPGQCTPVPPDPCDVTLTYTPNADFNGSDSFAFTVDDGVDGTSSAETVDITIDPVNDAPVAVDNDAAGPEDQPMDVFVLLNDTDVDGDLLSIDEASNAAHGTVAIVGSGNNDRLQYTPDADFNGFDDVTYTVSDGHGGSDTASVTIGVNPVNDAPTLIVPFDPEVDEDSGGESLGGFLDGDAGPPDEDATQNVGFVIDDVTPTSLFSVQPQVNPNGTLSFTPAPNATGVATVTAHATDTGGTDRGGVDVSPQQQFTITITLVNDAPSLQLDPGPTVAEDFSNAPNGFVSLPQFADGDPGPPDEDATQSVDFVVDSVANPSLFSVQPDINPDGTLQFKLAANANGSTVVKVHAVDTGGTSNGGVNVSPQQQLTITVTPVNDPPIAVDDGSSTAIPIPQNAGATPIAVLLNDSTVDAGASLTIVAVSQGAHGVVAITGGGSGLSYNPAGSFTGPDAFTYTISDGALQDTATVHVDVAPDITGPVTSIRVVGTASRAASSVRVTVTWSAVELQSGVARYQLQQQTDGGAWTTIALTPVDATRLERVLAGGHDYAFRVRGFDGIGNQGAYATSPTLRL